MGGIAGGKVSFMSQLLIVSVDHDCYIYVHACFIFNHKGLKQLRQAICDFHQKYDGFDDLDPEEIVVGPGSKELIYLVMHVFNGGK